MSSAVAREIHFGYRKRQLPADVRPPFRPGQWWDMTEAARAFHRCRVRLKGYAGGLGSGKTYAAARETGFLGFRNLGFTILVVEPRWADFDEIFCPAFEEALEEAGLERGTHWSYHGTRHHYSILGGPRRGGFGVQLRTGDDPDAIVGANIAAAVVDEPASMPAKILTAVKKRVRVGTQEIALVGTLDPGTWFAKRVASWRKQRRANEEYFTATTLDNPKIDQGYIDDMASSLDAATYQALVEGKSVTLGGGAYKSFRDAPYPDGNIAPWTYDPALPVILAIDNNKRPQCAVLAQPVGDVTRVFDEVTLDDGAYTILVSAIVRKLGGKPPAGFILAGDATCRGRIVDEATSWGEFELLAGHLRSAFPSCRHQLRVPKGNPLQIDRLLAVNARLCNVAGERRILFDPRCTETIEDYRSVATDADGNILKGRGVDEARTHHSDALDYYEAYEHPIRHGGPGRNLQIATLKLPPR